MKAHKCTKCDNQTFQKDSICVSCKLGLSQMHAELKDLLKKDKRLNLHMPKM